MYKRQTFISAVFTIVPIALATMMEHIGDIAAISATTGKNYIRDPGLNKTLLGDGLATAMAGLLGGPANTTYGAVSYTHLATHERYIVDNDRFTRKANSKRTAEA